MKSHKDRNKEFRARLAKHLKLSDDPDRVGFIWNCLVEDKYINDWRQGYIKEKEVLDIGKGLLDRFRAWEKRFRVAEQPAGQPLAGRAMQQDVPVEPTERERQITEALSKYLAVDAARWPLVQRFRREDLPHGRLLTEDEEIERFLAAEPGGEANLDGYLDRGRDELDLVFPFKLNAEPPAQGTLVQTDKEVAETRYVQAAHQEKQLEEEWEGPPGWRLQALGEWLVDIYPWESVGDAVVFVVSGRPPRLAEPLSAAIDIHKATYSITFSPWVSEETIVRAYRETQHNRHRLPQAKIIRVLRFVSDQADNEGTLPTWQTLFDRWNAANPDMRYVNRDGLFRAYKSAINSLVPPYLPLT